MLPLFCLAQKLLAVLQTAAKQGQSLDLEIKTV